MTLALRRALVGFGCVVAVLTASVALALPAEAATFTTRCVVAREMRIYHTSTSSNPAERNSTSAPRSTPTRRATTAIAPGGGR